GRPRALHRRPGGARTAVDRDRHDGGVAGGRPRQPPSVGVASAVRLPSAGLVSPTTGAIVSTVKVFAELRPTFPAASDCSACACTCLRRAARPPPPTTSRQSAPCR